MKIRGDGEIRMNDGQLFFMGFVKMLLVSTGNINLHKQIMVSLEQRMMHRYTFH